jgi:hypothetical protein
LECGNVVPLSFVSMFSVFDAFGTRTNQIQETTKTKKSGTTLPHSKFETALVAEAKQASCKSLAGKNDQRL